MFRNANDQHDSIGGEVEIICFFRTLRVKKLESIACYYKKMRFVLRILNKILPSEVFCLGCVINILFSDYSIAF